MVVMTMVQCELLEVVKRVMGDHEVPGAVVAKCVAPDCGAFIIAHVDAVKEAGRGEVLLVCEPCVKKGVRATFAQ